MRCSPCPCAGIACEVRLRSIWALAATTGGELGALEHRAARLGLGMWRYIPATARHDAPRTLAPPTPEALTDCSATAWSLHPAPDRPTITDNLIQTHPANAQKETTMNYTARALASVIALVAADAIPATNDAVAGDQFPDWTGMWKIETGEADVVDEAHIQMKTSGKIFRIIGIRNLDDPKQARIAMEGIARLIQGKKLDCWWLPDPAAAGNPMAAAADGTPFGSCGVRKVRYAFCKAEHCQLQVMVVRNGQGIPEGGPWEQRTPAASNGMATLVELEATARSQERGIWAQTR